MLLCCDGVCPRTTHFTLIVTNYYCFSSKINDDSLLAVFSKALDLTLKARACLATIISNRCENMHVLST